jgi:branched-chain amino acid transport system ATP-binding protein
MAAAGRHGGGADAMTALAAPPLLDATSVSKRFAGIVALADVSLQVDTGELVAVIGPNGAGKSTLFNCLTGVLRPERGSVSFDGQAIDRLRPSQRARRGIARTFQRIELFSGMTVLEHLIVAERARTRRGALWSDLFRPIRPGAAERSRCEEVLELVDLTDLADRPAESLSLGKGRLVELARALMCEPRLLFLDEPSSGLDRHETDEMAGALSAVRSRHSTSVVLIEHDVRMVNDLADRTYVLDYGQLIASGPTAEVLADRRVRAAYLGDCS